MSWFALLALVALVAVLALGLSRHLELFVLAVDGKHVRIVRGRLPQRLLNDIQDVTKRTQSRGRIVVKRRDGAPRLVLDGDFDANIAQRLRNVVAMWPVAKIKNAPPPRR